MQSLNQLQKRKLKLQQQLSAIDSKIAKRRKRATETATFILGTAAFAADDATRDALRQLMDEATRERFDQAVADCESIKAPSPTSDNPPVKGGNPSPK